MNTAGQSEGREVDARAEDGVTRREALKRGTMAGLGLVWVAPRVDSFTISAQTAQATSGVGRTEPTDENQGSTDENQGNNEGQGSNDSQTNDETSHNESSGNENEENDENQGSKVGSEQVEADQVSEVGSEQVQASEEDQGSEVGSEQVQGKVVSGDTLPFTGLPIEQLLPLAGGAIATGAAAVRLSKERGKEEVPGDGDSDSV